MYARPGPNLFLVGIITAFTVVGLVFGFLLGYLYLNSKGIITLREVFDFGVIPEQQKVILPIDPKNSSVNTAGVLYLLSGVIEQANPIGQGGKEGVEIELRTPTGPVLQKKFFVIPNSATVVYVGQDGAESKYDLYSLQKGQSVKLNFYLDLLAKDRSGQVTKIAVYPNR